MMETAQTNISSPSFGAKYPISERQYDVPDDRARAMPIRDLYLLWVPKDKSPAVTYEAKIVPLGDWFKAEKGRSSDALPECVRDNWQRLAKSGLSDDLYSRLIMLANKPDGWRGKGSRRLNTASLRHFLNFWCSVKGHAVEPFVTLAPSGHLSAEWHASWKRHLDIEFIEDGNVFFGLFQGNRVHEGREEASELAAMLLSRNANPLKWRS